MNLISCHGLTISVDDLPIHDYKAKETLLKEACVGIWMLTVWPWQVLRSHQVGIYQVAATTRIILSRLPCLEWHSRYCADASCVSRLYGMTACRTTPTTLDRTEIYNVFAIVSNDDLTIMMEEETDSPAPSSVQTT